MADTFEFTLDEESEKKLYDILTDVNTEKTLSFTITDKYGNTAEYAKVVHGRWESGRYRSVDQTGETYDDGEALICTNCRCGFKKKIVDWRWDYCPACGARMDGDRDELTKRL